MIKKVLEGPEALTTKEGVEETTPKAVEALFKLKADQRQKEDRERKADQRRAKDRSRQAKN